MMLDDPAILLVLREAYPLMLRHYGHQGWWPAESPFEVCVGAILTQNTNWRNVERAIQNLKAAQALNPEKLRALPPRRLAELIRPAGYYNVKAQRLHGFLDVLFTEYHGRLEALFSGSTPEVRKSLLGIRGIGPETADSMLLYAGNHLSFVVDAYTRRIFSRHGWCTPREDYSSLQNLCARALSVRSRQPLLDYWQDYHAQLVHIGKDFCKTRQPQCQQCPLNPLLPEAVDNFLAAHDFPDI